MRFIFDFTIIFILSFSGYWMYLIIRSFFYDKKNNIRTKLIRIFLLIILLLIFITIFYGSFIEPQRIKINPVEINLAQTSEKENIKIVFLTDLHVGAYKQSDFVEKVVKLTNEQYPDLILLGGDYILGDEENAKFLNPLKNLNNNYSGKIFAVTGNHEFNAEGYNSPKIKDKTKLLRQIFADSGIKMLDNENQFLDIGGNKIFLAGISDLWSNSADLQTAQKISAGQELPLTKILLSHNPDIILDPQSENFNLIISGHTHAGQIRLPFIGSVPEIPDQLGRAFDHGLFKLKNGFLYASAGLGESGTRARLFNPPELTVINLDL
ncbi:metallophosphoesterase [Patescibacteria group bacterium]|nr:metallophosphoesterase [Patescibacteria group bacterium]